MSGPTREPRLIDALVTLADAQFADYDLVELMQYLVEVSVDLLDAAAAGLLLADGDGHLDVLASTSERTELLEVLQIRTGRGPMRRVLPHRGGADDPANRRADGAVAADQRRWPWIGATGRCPRWRRGRRDQTVGALNLFRAEPWGTGRTRPPRRQGAGRRRHHRRPAAPRRPGRRRGERTVPARARRGERGVRVPAGPS